MTFVQILLLVAAVAFVLFLSRRKKPASRNRRTNAGDSGTAGDGGSSHSPSDRDQRWSPDDSGSDAGGDGGGGGGD